MTDYEWLTDMGLCHRCRKEKAAPHKKFCFDCLDMIRKENIKRYDPKAAKQYQERRRELYRIHKEQGKCVRCKKQATQGMYCIDCYLKVRRHNKAVSNRRKEARSNTNIRKTREENGLCLWCGERAKEGYKCCEKHYQLLCRAGDKARANTHPFRTMERIRYGKIRRNGYAEM